jgi:hypothetical protein
MREIAQRCQALAALDLLIFSNAARTRGLGLGPMKPNFCKKKLKKQKRGFYPRQYPIRGPYLEVNEKLWFAGL